MNAVNHRDSYKIAFHSDDNQALYFRECRLREARQICREHRIMAKIFDDQGR